MSRPHPESEECTQSENIEGIKRELGKLNTAVFYGNGQPSLTTQMAVISKTVYALVWVASVTLAAVISQAIILFFKMAQKL